MKKGLIVSILVFIFILPVVSASLSSSMDKVQDEVDLYEAGEISAPQLVVYIEYIKNKMYEELDKQNKNAFNESEVVAVFDKVAAASTYRCPRNINLPSLVPAVTTSAV